MGRPAGVGLWGSVPAGDGRRCLYIQLACIVFVSLLCVHNLLELLSSDYGRRSAGVSSWVWRTETTYSWSASDISGKVFERSTKTEPDPNPVAASLPPLGLDCTAAQFLASVASGSRNGIRDGPFHTSCQLRNYTSSEACGVLASFDSILVFGESHERHFVQGLFSLIRNNTRGMGGLQNWRIPPGSDVDRQCQGEEAFEEKDCRWVVLTTTDHMGPETSTVDELAPRDVMYDFCPGYLPPTIKSIYSYKPERVNIRFTNSILAHHPRSVLLYGWGFHAGLDSANALQHLIAPMDQLAQEYPGTTQVVLSRHSAQANRPEQYEATQGNGIIQRYNEELAAALAMINENRPDRRPIHYFDMYNLTREASSFDGSHYGLRVNLLKAQVAINFLDRLRHELGYAPRFTRF